MRITNATRGQILAANARVADTFWRRLRGLLGTRQLAAGAGLVIRPCNSVHTVGMMYPIDVVFVDHQGAILRVIANLAACSAAVCRGSDYVIELPAGTLAATHTTSGDQLQFE